MEKGLSGKVSHMWLCEQIWLIWLIGVAGRGKELDGKCRKVSESLLGIGGADKSGE